MLVELDIHRTQSLRGKPAIVVNGIRYLQMSDNSKRTLWRCSYMKSKTLKCPARITEYKDGLTSRYVVNKGDHEHAELKRGKYFVKSDMFTDYSIVEESIVGYEYMLPSVNE